MNATFTTKDQNWQNEQTVYWFDVDGEEYGVSEQPDDTCIVDCDGCPVNIYDAKNSHVADLASCVTEEMRAS